MNFTLIICSYMRPIALRRLLESVKLQTLYPNQIIIVDGSTNAETKAMLQQESFKTMEYYLVDATTRGLTKQRNFGITKVAAHSEIVCFLDDDIVLEPTYFEMVIKTYNTYPKALGVGGYISNEVQWDAKKPSQTKHYFCYDGWCRIEPKRFKIRAQFGLAPDAPPGILPTFSHMRAIGFLPPSGKIYPVELFMGGVASYKTEVFNMLKFSEYFEGYGLYEDADFCLRLSKLGPLYVNTAARCEHHHALQGRPNTYNYGKMVMRNGWYIWRVKYKNPKLKARLKWHATGLILTGLTVLGGITHKNRNLELQEAFGRIMGWWSLVFNKPRIESHET